MRYVHDSCSRADIFRKRLRRAVKHDGSKTGAYRPQDGLLLLRVVKMEHNWLRSRRYIRLHQSGYCLERHVPVIFFPKGQDDRVTAIRSLQDSLDGFDIVDIE